MVLRLSSFHISFYKSSMKFSDMKFFHYSGKYNKLNDTFQKPSELEEFSELHG